MLTAWGFLDVCNNNVRGRNMQRNDIIICRMLYILLSTTFIIGLVLFMDTYGPVSEPAGLYTYDDTQKDDGESIAVAEPTAGTDVPDSAYGLTYDAGGGRIIIDRKITKLNKDTVNISENAGYEYVLDFDGDVTDINRFRLIGDGRAVSFSYNGSEKQLKINGNAPLTLETEFLDSEIIVHMKTMKDIYDKIVYIDAGHGGADDGAARDMNYEKNINLNIALMLYDMIEKGGSGIKALLSRDSDIEIDRYDRAAQGSLLADAIVSIHCNTFTSSSVHGTETLFNPGQIMSGSRLNMSILEYSNILQRNLCAEIGSRDRGLQERPDLVVLAASSVPSVILEVGYMSNRDELQKLIDTEYQRKIAVGIYNGILEVFGITEPPL